jgi:lipoprotein-anchoring transpeptidase ErfK/SrfK
MYGIGWLGDDGSDPPVGETVASNDLENADALPREAENVQPSERPIETKPRSPVMLTGVEKAREADHSVGRRESGSGDTSPPSPRASRSLQQADAAQRAAAAGNWLAARELYSQALTAGLPDRDAQRAGIEASDVADRTLFSDAAMEGDPHVDMYVIQPGDTLGKLAKEWDITAGLLASINNIADVNRIRAGQRIKYIRGPFRATVARSAHRLDVWLGDVFVRTFPVALGSSGSTPMGEWKVKEKLTDPTYYPPRGGRIIRADDPENPLGERWIGLEGISGEAVGQMRYGIHGTIEPESIGQDVSLGCVRMLNEDVQFLYDLLVVNDSTVIIGP